MDDGRNPGCTATSIVKRKLFRIACQIGGAPVGARADRLPPHALRRFKGNDIGVEPPGDGIGKDRGAGANIRLPPMVKFPVS
jgi:hypothetical protein